MIISSSDNKQTPQRSPKYKLKQKHIIIQLSRDKKNANIHNYKDTIPGAEGNLLIVANAPILYLYSSDTKPE